MLHFEILHFEDILTGELSHLLNANIDVFTLRNAQKHTAFFSEGLICAHLNF